MTTGVDYYSGNGAINLGGSNYAFHKATEGTSYRDPAYDIEVQRIRAKGIVAGSYHFAWLNESAATQASFYRKIAKPVVGDILYLDLEPYSDNRNWPTSLTRAQVQTWVNTWITQVKSGISNKVGVYCDVAIYNKFGPFTKSDFLFIADYSTRSPITKPPYTFWQHTDTPVDLSIGPFSTTQELKDWAEENEMALTAAEVWDEEILYPGGLGKATAWAGLANTRVLVGEIKKQTDDFETRLTAIEKNIAIIMTALKVS